MTDRDDMPIYLSFDEAADEYEATDEFFNDACNEILAVDAATITDPLRSAIIAWFRTQGAYVLGVHHVQDEAAR